MKTSLATLALFATLMVVPTLDATAQQSTGAKTPKDRASVETSLVQLGQALKQSVVRRGGPSRKIYIRLKYSSDCNISFRESVVSYSESQKADGRTPTNELSITELRLSLSDLDPAEVSLDAPRERGYQLLRFAATGGKESIKRIGFRPHENGWTSEGFISVETKHASQIVTALQQAIVACRQ